MRVSAMFLSCMTASLLAATSVHPVRGMMGDYRLEVAQAPDEDNQGGARHTVAPASAPAAADQGTARQPAAVDEMRSTRGIISRPPAQAPAQVPPPPRNESTQGQKNR